MKKNKILKLFYLYLLIQPILDIITSLTARYLSSLMTPGLIIRGLFLVISTFYILFLSKSKYNKISRIYMILLGFFSIIYFVIRPEMFNSLSIFIKEISYMIKYFYTIIFLIFLFNFYEEYKPDNTKIMKILIINMLVYSASILIANLTGTAIATYLGGIGNVGWFYSGNEIGNILAILMPLFIIIVHKYRSYYTLILLIPIVFIMIFIGTKTSFIGLVIPLSILLYIYISMYKPKTKIKKIAIILLLIISGFFAGYPVFNNIKMNIRDLRNETGKVIIKDLILSNRNKIQNEVEKIYNNSELSNKLFGIGFLNKTVVNNFREKHLIEMDGYDIFYRYGIIGFIIFFILFMFIIIEVFKELFILKFKLNIYQILLIYCSLISMVISFIVGHSLGAPAVSTYIVIILVLLIYYLKHKTPPINDKKITILNLHLGIGGTEQYLQSLCEMLINNYEIEYISTYKLEKEIKLNKEVNVKYLINDYPHINEFKKSLKEFNMINIIKIGYSLFKILILKYYKNIEVIGNIDSKYIITTRIFHNNLVGKSRKKGTVAITTEHNYHNNNNKYVKKVVKSCNNIDYLLLVSEELQEYYKKIIQESKCVYIPNVITDIAEFKSKDKITKKLVSVGRLVPEKKFEDLIDIIYEIKKEIFDIKLDIYGDGPLKTELENKIKSKNLENNIKLKGSIENKELLKKLEEYDLFLMTSITESFGIVLLEAMSRGLACVAFDSASGARMLLKDNQGILIENRDINLYTNKVIKLLNNKNLLNEISFKGHESIKKYDINVVKSQWLELLGNPIKNSIQNEYITELLEKTYKDSIDLNINEYITESLIQNKKEFIVTINPEAYIYAEKDENLREMFMSDKTKLIPDAISVVYAIKKVLNKKINKSPGVDIFKSMLEIGSEHKKTIYLYGAKEEVNKDMELYITKNHNNLKVVGRCNGYEKDIEKVKKEIIKLKPDIIAVALGMPRQELFISEIYEELNKGIMIGIGGSFDAITNHVKRAPKIFQKLNLEWLYRIIKEPKRFKRFYNNNIKFVMKLKKKKNETLHRHTRDFLDKINKYFKKIKRDGLVSATKKAFLKIKSDYLSIFNIRKILNYNKNKHLLEKDINNILKNDYERIIIWRSSIGWNIPLFQRPQHLVRFLSDSKTLIFYEVTNLTDKVDYIEKKKDNLYLVNYESRSFSKMFRNKLKKITKPKYIFTASTCWDLSDTLIDGYIKEGYKFIYDYLDHLSPELAGTDTLPRNVTAIHNYVINNVEDVFVIATADILYEDIKNKRGTDKNLLFACNGVDFDHFDKLDKKIELAADYLKIIKSKKPIIGYYGALASWFDYDLIKYFVEEKKDFNIVLIGSKYDTSFDKQELEKYKNIYYIGAKKYEELPYYATHFDVCVLPFLLNEITASTSPIKVFEYMALGKPIVTTDLNECRKYKSIKIAKTKKEFVKLCEKMINMNDKEYFKQLKKDALDNSWQSKAEDIINALKDFEK